MDLIDIVQNLYNKQHRDNNNNKISIVSGNGLYYKLENESPLYIVLDLISNVESQREQREIVSAIQSAPKKCNTNLLIHTAQEIYNFMNLPPRKIRNFFIISDLSYVCMFEDDPTTQVSFSELMTKTFPEDVLRECEDKLAQMAVLEYPLLNVGYIRSSRFTEFISKSVLVPYGTIVAYNAWFLSTMFNRPAKTYSHLFFKPPFKTSSLEDVFESMPNLSDNQMFQNYEEIIRLIKFLNEAMKQKLYGGDFKKTHDKETMTEHLTKLVEENVTENNRQTYESKIVSPKIIEVEETLRKYSRLSLEYYLSVQENIELLKLFLLACFYIHAPRVGFFNSFYTMRQYFHVLYDLNLMEDLPRILEIPIQTMYLISIDKDCPFIRNSSDKILFREFSIKRLNQLQFYQHHMSLKNRSFKDSEEYKNLIDTVPTIAQDKIEYDELRLNQLYLLFLYNNKRSRDFYTAFLAAMFERARMINQNSTFPKQNMKQRIEDLKLIHEIFQSFETFARNIITIEEEENHFPLISLSEINNYIQVNRHLFDGMFQMVLKNMPSLLQHMEEKLPNKIKEEENEAEKKEEAAAFLHPLEEEEEEKDINMEES